MTRSKTILSALLCSVSFIPLAEAAPSRVTDWHVAPVLAVGKNTAPYCALAANYPDAGVIVTHARNKHGGGTLAFDFRRADFEPREFYGIEVGFGNNVRTFAAEARNKHLLVVEIQRDPALYAALDAGKDLHISVQQGGPDVTLAGNTRLFFQLNYCVQALNDAAPGQIVVQDDHAAPSFGLQQPAPAAITKPIVLRRPPVDPADLNAAQLIMTPGAYPQQTRVVAAPPPKQQVVQTASNQDGDQTRSDLQNMLKNARKEDASSKPVRQKLSSISSSDDIDPNSVAPINRNSRQSLLFDDPNAVNSYVPPRLGDTEKAIEKMPAAPVKKIAAPAPAKTIAPVVAKKPTPVIEKPVAVTIPVAPEPAKTIAAPSAALMKDTRTSAPVVDPVIATPSANALPAPLPLPDDSAPVMAAPTAITPAADAKTDALVARMQEATKKPQAKIVSDVSRTVLASDYVNEKQNGVPAPEFNAAEAKKVAEKTAPVKAIAAKTAAPAVIAAPTISWDKPGAAKAAETKTVAVPETAKTPMIESAALDAPPSASPSAASPSAQNTIFTGKPAPVRKAPVLKTATETAPHHPAPVLSKTATADLAPSPSLPTPAMAELTTPAPVLAAPVKAPAIAAVTPLAALAERTDEPVKTAMPPVAKIAQPVAEKPAAVMAEPVPMPAPALPPPIIEETVLNNDVRGPMRPADEAVNVTFPEEEIHAEVVPDVPMATTTIANKALPIPADVLQTMRFKAIDFKPPASAAAKGWDVSTVAATDAGGSFCVMKNRFVNQQSLFLSRSADGNATLGLDYGMDLLEADRDYKTSVQLDNTFAEDFIGQARKPNLLVVQMGRKDSFFSALGHAKALHIELDGGASTFDVQGAAPKMAAMNSCTMNQGGTSIVTEAVAETKAVLKNVVAAVTPDSTPAPVAVVVTPNPAAATPAPAMTAFTIAPNQINALLQKAQIQGSVRSDSQGYRWGSSLDPIQGQMLERRFLAGKADLLEAVMRDLDQAEQACGGAFSSEVGTPEQYGDMESLVAETRCGTAGNATVQASLYQRLGQVFRVWMQKGSEADRDQLIRQRDRLAKALDQDTSMQTATGITGEPRS
jgi:hypothetical protein